jgi:pimeloyl-ACP methyl ester carboxylesterase
MPKNDSRWSAAEMGAPKSNKQRAVLEREIRKLEIENVSSDNPGGEQLTCKFALHYSFIKPRDPNNPSPKNVLFIPGGPGTIVPLQDLDLASNDGRINFLEVLENEGHNVAYLHVRGSGLSQVPQPNKFDRFLRADYVVKDIERLRLQLLGKDTPWDAIWAESHGAVIAQRYAYKYGTARVKKLVLLAPPSRSVESHTHRRNLMASNLEAIIKNYRGHKGDSANDLSFVTNQDLRKIKNKFKQTLKKLDRTFGSMSFVMENYAELKKRDPNLESFPYPKEFFKALRNLQFLGRPAKNLKFRSDTEQGHFNAALLVSHYLSLPGQQLNARGKRTGIRTPSIIRSLSSDGRSVYKKMFGKAQKALSKAGQLKSHRAYYIFGVYDGISRWILDAMHRQIDKDGFFRSEEIQRFVKGPVAQDLARKMGVVPGEPIYPWNAGYYKHDVPTLIIKGSADPVVAGGQAENFFKDGLANKEDSVLMEFPGMGHLWRDSMPMAIVGAKETPGFKVLQILAREFLTKPSASAFLIDPKVREIIETIGASVLGPRRSREGKLTRPKVKKLMRVDRTKRELWGTIMRLRRRGMVSGVEKTIKSRAEIPKTKSTRAGPTTN